MIWQLFTAGLTVAFGALALWVATRMRRDARRIRGWQTCPGRILERGIEPLAGTGQSFTPKIRYSYSVAGKEYVGANVYRTGRVGRLKGAATRLVNALPDPIPVHYNPENPEEAYLLTVPGFLYWLTVGFGICAVVWGLCQAMVSLVQA